MKIHILTNNNSPCSWAFNCPLILGRDFFSKENIFCKFYLRITEELFQSDCLFINSNVFRTYWKNDKKTIFKTLENARSHGQKIVWFDTTDSTWCTQFEVLPYVDLFLKNQLLKDRNKYLKKYRTGRIFTDFFDELYNAGDYEFKYFLPEEDELDKIDVSWAPCFQNYNESRFTFLTKIKNLTRPFITNFQSGNLKIDFFPPAGKRTNIISARFGFGHSRISVVAHRQKVKMVLEERGVDCTRISLHDYFKELKNSRICVSPYGVGEFCYRDYESIVCGTTLVKPDMSHMVTWPNFYQENKTYLAHQWDLADLLIKLDFLIANPDFCREISENAQNFYKHVISSEGIKEFVERLISFLNKI